MAVLTSIVPADNAIEVGGDQHFVARLEDSAGVDRTLVEVIVNGVSHTVANGRLEYWGYTTIAGGTIVEDWTAVYFGTRGSWFDISGQTIDVEVRYNGVILDTITVRVAEFAGHPSAAQGHFEAWATTPDWQAGRAGGWYFILDYYPDGERIGWYVVEPPSDGAMDGWYLVGRYVLADVPAGAVVGQRSITDAPAAGIVLGWSQQNPPAAAVAQAWLLAGVAAAGLPATVTLADLASAAIVGVLSTTSGSAAALVYGVNRRTCVEVRSVSAETAAMLDALGVSRA